MYVRVTTIAHALLVLVFQPVAHAWQLSALYGLGPLPTGFLAAPAPPWVYYQGPYDLILDVFYTLRGEYGYPKD